MCTYSTTTIVTKLQNSNYEIYNLTIQIAKKITGKNCGRLRKKIKRQMWVEKKLKIKYSNCDKTQMVEKLENFNCWNFTTKKMGRVKKNSKPPPQKKRQPMWKLKTQNLKMWREEKTYILKLW